MQGLHDRERCVCEWRTSLLIFQSCCSAKVVSRFEMRAVTGPWSEWLTLRAEICSSSDSTFSPSSPGSWSLPPYIEVLPCEQDQGTPRVQPLKLREMYMYNVCVTLDDRERSEI